MRERRNNWIIALLPLVVCAVLVGVSLPAHAAGSDSVPVEVTTTAKKGVTVPTGQKYDIVTTAKDNAPAIATVTVTDNGTAAIALPTYTAVGIYHYTVAMTPQNKADGFTYDTRTYRLDVYVTNGKDGGLETAAVLYDGQDKKDDSKTTQVTFKNTYTETTTPEKPGKPEKPNKPGTPEKPSTPNTPKSDTPKSSTGKPKTGDTTSQALPIAMMSGAAAVLALVLAGSRRKSDD